ncbi:hypothetical protein S2M10_06810 [Sphingomonas sp. S2M10]|nr:hypothetical protein [Sphingomonas sp. S2M10]
MLRRAARAFLETNMSVIHLHGPATANDGSFIDAGTDVTIGDKPKQIAADRASELVKAHTAKRGAGAPAPTSSDA